MKPKPSSPSRDPEQTYRVCWQIDLFATSNQDAADRALATQRDPASLATNFQVARWRGSPPRPNHLAYHFIEAHVPCADCGDGGWLIVTHNGHEEIQRCDNCEKCQSDLEAAQAFFKEPDAAKYCLDTVRIRPK